ncbi:MAG: biopolymer transporter ExbD [Verrucomicrobiia bacterium]
MKFGTPVEVKKARIEIIPLIDIMFFLLAVMMMVSLGLVKLNAIQVNLPTAQTATEDNRQDFVTVSITADGTTFLDKDAIGRDQIIDALKERRAAQPELRVLVQGDADALHRDVMMVLDRIRAAGIQRIGFQTKKEEAPEAAKPTGSESS